MDIANFWVVERQEQTGTWHIDTLARSLQSNLQMLLETGQTNSYIPLATFGTHQQASEFIAKVDAAFSEIAQKADTQAGDMQIHVYKSRK